MLRRDSLLADSYTPRSYVVEFFFRRRRMPSPLEAQLHDTLGGSYTVERELGGGGMSRVFLAEERALGRRVVIKILAPELAEGLSAERFAREIKLAATLQQPNIVPVLTAGDVGGLPYYTMPFIEGRSLREHLGDGPLAVAEVVSILKDVARALTYAHGHGIVHRDIKPDNILLSGGTAVVTDFGIAKALADSRRPESANGLSTAGLTAVGTSIGTPAYVAPEQAAGDPLTDHRADIYAFGCTAYELLTGRPPFIAASPHKLLGAHLTERPTPVGELRRDTPPALAQLVMHCLEKDPDRRPQDTANMAGDLERVASSDAVATALAARHVPLWRALLAWAVAFGAAYILAKAAIVGIGLPDWVLPGAMLVAALGLPAVLGTHLVQRTARAALVSNAAATPGGSGAATGTLASFAIRAAPHIGWRRTWRWSVAGGGVFVLAVAAFMLLRAFGIGPAGSLFAKGVLQRHDKIIIADFGAPDTVLASAITDALRADLSQSKVVNVLRPSAVRETLARMGRSQTLPIGASLAREVAEREGAKVVITGDVAPLGGGYLLNARVLDPRTGDPLATFHETAKDATDVLPAIARLSKQLRGKIGESLRTLQNLPPTENVTTTSLEAFRKYTQAVELDEGVTQDLGRALQLQMEAVALDSNFAMAYRKLAFLDPDPARQKRWAMRAYALRARLSPVERYETEGQYQVIVLGDLDAGIESYRRAFATDSTVLRSVVNISDYCGRKGDWACALEWGSRAARVSDRWAENEYRPLVGLGHRAEAERVAQHVDSSRGALAVTPGMHGLGLVALAEYDSAEALANRLKAMTFPEASWFGFLLGSTIAATRGRLEQAAAETRRGWSLPFTLPRVDPWSWWDGTKPVLDSWFLDQHTGAVASTDSLVRANHFDTRGALDSSPVPYLLLIKTYAQARRPDKARAWLTRYLGVARDSLDLRLQQASLAEARGWIALSEGKPRDAVAEFSRAAKAPMACRLCERAPLGLAFDLAGQPDSTRVIYEQVLASTDMLEIPGVAMMFRALMLKRLGELYEARGSRDGALSSYGKFVELWKHADAPLQPQVRDVQARIARLQADRASRR